MNMARMMRDWPRLVERIEALEDELRTLKGEASKIRVSDSNVASNEPLLSFKMPQFVDNTAPDAKLAPVPASEPSLASTKESRWTITRRARVEKKNFSQ